MAIQKIEMHPKGTGNYADILYPKTSSDMVVDETGTTTLALDYTRRPGVANATGSANTYAVTLTPAPTAYVDLMGVSVKINVDATGASTLNVNGLGAKPIKKANGLDFTNAKANGVYAFRYNASTGNFILQGEGGSGTATAGDILAGKTASTDTGDVTGTMVDRGSMTITPGTTDQIIPAGKHDGTGKVVGDADLIAANIKNGISVFGVIGTLLPLSGTAGDAQALAADIERSTQSITYVKAKELKITESISSVRVKFDLRCSNNAAWARVYKNGVAVGTERTTLSSTNTTYIEDISVTKDDLIQLYFRIANASYIAYVSNFRLGISLPSIGTVITD